MWYFWLHPEECISIILLDTLWELLCIPHMQPIIIPLRDFVKHRVRILLGFLHGMSVDSKNPTVVCGSSRGHCMDIIWCYMRGINPWSLPHHGCLFSHTPFPLPPTCPSHYPAICFPIFLLYTHHHYFNSQNCLLIPS